jgi:nitric oxide dioxygenase
VVTAKQRESEVITSFVLKPRDGGGVVLHKPGQYLTLRFDTPHEIGLKRNYSISAAPNGKSLRISVKREVDGRGSGFLHDHVQVGDALEITPPAGDFFLAENPERPVVLLSGGVGLTPMVSMIETIAQRHPDLEAHFVHAAVSSATHAMDQHVRDLARGHGRIKVATFYSNPLESDEAGETHDADGLVSIDWLADNTPFANADFYLCGPKPFLRAFVGGLVKAGVPADQIHYELFGPTDESMAA